jgi:hypothetical protein
MTTVRMWDMVVLDIDSLKLRQVRETGYRNWTIDGGSPTVVHLSGELAP